MLSSGSRARLKLEAGARDGLPVGSSVGETQWQDKHVVAHIGFAEDVGSTPTASTKHIGVQVVMQYEEAGRNPTSTIRLI